MDFWRSLNNTHKIVIGIAVATLVIALIVYFCSGKSNEKMVALRQAAPEAAPKAEETKIQEIPDDGKKSQAVMVMFFAPWCGHCKTMMPTWDKFAKKWDGYKGVRIIKIDGQTDSKMAAKHQVGGFPTVKFCPKGLDEPMEAVIYQGDRSEGDLEQFLKQFV